MDDDDDLIELVVESGPAAGRIDRWLADHAPQLTRARIQSLCEEGRISLDGKPLRKLSGAPKAGMAFTIELPPPEPVDPQPEAMPLHVLFEDADVIAVNKPAGLVVHPAPGHAAGTLVNGLLHHCGANLGGIGGALRPGIVHRLDKDTSGVIIVAKNDAAMQGLVRLFQDRALRKEYRALVHGLPVPREGRVETLIGRHPGHRQKMANVERNGKTAVTRYSVVGSFPARGFSHLGCVIETGRTHQIRVHLSGLGHPILGDSLYGNPGKDKKLSPLPARQMLHAFRLTLPHPITGALLNLEAPLPEDFNAFLEHVSNEISGF